MESISEHIEKIVNSIALENGISKPRLECSACSGTGDNYVGKLYRVLVKDDDGESHRELHLIVKTPPASKQRRDQMRTGVYFQNEAHVYQNILPALADCYKKKDLLAADALYPHTPKAYACVTQNDENDVIILEDLRHRGFLMKDRRDGLDGAHCRLVVQELARLHAASLALQKSDPDLHNHLADRLTENVFVKPKEGDDSLISTLNERCRNSIKERFPEGTEARAKFEHFAEDFRNKMRGYLTKDSKLLVLNHGDTWINNLLFKYDEEDSGPKELCLIDFQIMRLASPALDLSYFLFTSTTKETRDKHYEDLMKSYHRNLVKFLEELGVDGNSTVPWDLFQQDLQEHAAYGWGMAMIVIPLFLADKNDIISQDEEIDKDSNQMFLKKSEGSYLQKERLSDLLEDVVRLGYL